MAASLSKGLGLSTCLKKMDEAAGGGNKQGIVSILGSDCETTKAASLRRTLSADMSSKKWLEQQGFSSPMKKISSVADSSSSSSSSDSEDEDCHERRGQLEIWSSERNKEVENPGQFDIWASILSQKAEQEDSSKSDPSAAPYIHPLVKRSSSSLSEKSLKICTESLCSETGSDGFSSYPPSSETSELDHQEEEQPPPEQQHHQQEDWGIAKYSNKAPSRSFPPPLPSISRGRGDGPSLRVQSHRKNGRLVLEAVSVTSQNYFSAQRQDGRLLLTFANTPNSAEDKDHQEIVEDDKEEIEELSDDDEEEFGNSDEEEELVENFEKEIGPILAKTEVIYVHRASVMMDKLINRNPTWPKRINEVIKFQDSEEIEPTPLSKSFPIPPRTLPLLIPSPPSMAAAATFIVYDNCWRSNMVIFSKSTTTLKANDEQQDYLVPMIKGCKEPRRSLSFWEPYCIATS